MKKTTTLILMSCLLMTIFVACNMASRNTPSGEGENPVAAAPVEMDKMLKEIYYNLPDNVMPKYLKTEEQRQKLEEQCFKLLEESEEAPFLLYYLEFEGDFGYDSWEAAAYLTEDHKNVVVLVTYGSGGDWFVVESFKTLNYNIETQQFTEIELPLSEPYTADELIGEIINTKGVNITDKAKQYFNLTKRILIGFDKDGPAIQADLCEFINGVYKNSSAEVKKICGNFGNDFEYVEGTLPTIKYKWNGKLFERIQN
jgi:hypothetical protein